MPASPPTAKLPGAGGPGSREATQKLPPPVRPPSLWPLWRSDLARRCLADRYRMVWSVRASLAALTLGINGALALSPPAHYAPSEAWRFFVATLPYFVAALLGLGIHRWAGEGWPRLQWGLSLVMTGFEAAQIGVSFAWSGPGHAVTLAYLILMVSLFAIFVDAVHGLWAFLSGALAMSLAHALYSGGAIAYAPVIRPGVIGDPEVLALAHDQGLLVVAIVYLASAAAGARIRWQRTMLESQNRYITEQILRRYLPPTVAQTLLQDGESWQRPRRVEATVFFSDLVGFTRQAEKLDPEALSASLDAYLTEMVRIAHHHRGTVDKFIGDAVMVLFGAPVSLSPREQACLAVGMAVEMQLCIRDLARTWAAEERGLLPQARMGIHFGEMVIGSFGGPDRSDFTAVGDNVNVASRLESNCPPGGILVSESVWTLLDGAFPGSHKGDLQVKNRTAPIPVYEIEVPGTAQPGERAA